MLQDIKLQRAEDGKGLSTNDYTNEDKTKLTEVTAQLAHNGRYINILHPRFNVKTDGVSETAYEVYEALKWCVENDYIAYIPALTYICGNHDYGDGTTWRALKIPENSVMHVEKGAVFKLADNSPSWTRVVVPDSNVKIYGEITIDGNEQNITDRNEHMSGLFIHSKKNIYIESIISENAVGDNIQISGDEKNISENIKIDNVYCRKGGRKNFVIEGVTGLHVKYAVLDNHENDLNSLDVEPWDVGGERFYYNRFDYLKTIGDGNDFTAGMSKNVARSFVIDIGYMECHLSKEDSRAILMYAMEVNVEKLAIKPYGDNIIARPVHMAYGGILNIDSVRLNSCKSFAEISATSTLEYPELNIADLQVETTVPSTSTFIENRGGVLILGNFVLENHQGKAFYFYNTTGTLSLTANSIWLKNCGPSNESLFEIDQLADSYYPMTVNIGVLKVEDDRPDGVRANTIVRFGEPETSRYFNIDNLINPDNINFMFVNELIDPAQAYKLLGLENEPQIFVIKKDPEGKLIAPKGSIALRANGSTDSSIYVKETGEGNTGWVAK